MANCQIVLQLVSTNWLYKPTWTHVGWHMSQECTTNIRCPPDYKQMLHYYQRPQPPNSSAPLPSDHLWLPGVRLVVNLGYAGDGSEVYRVEMLMVHHVKIILPHTNPQRMWLFVSCYKQPI